MEEVRITYYGHACFGLACRGWQAVLDPYADGSVPGLRPLRLQAQAVYCSHGHGDHNFAQAVTLLPAAGEPPCTLQQFEVPHDDAGGALRGMCTVRVFTFGTLRVAHLGDIGCALTPAQAQQLFGVDCLLVPVGGFYTVDAAAAQQIVRQVAPRVVVPMHYRTPGCGLAKIAPLTDFIRLLPQVREVQDSAFTLTPHEPCGVVVLRAAMRQA